MKGVDILILTNIKNKISQNQCIETRIGQEIILGFKMEKIKYLKISAFKHELAQN